ncbi:hypothetical protein BH09BAC6_BH09BAC6_19260 [soil metagenome]|jgi:hypothetical protein
MKKKIAGIALIILFAGAIGTWYYVFRYAKTHHRDVENETAIETTAGKLVRDFQTNETEANKIYLQKVIQIKGEVLKTDKDQVGNVTVTLKSGDPFSNIFCTLKPGFKNNKKNSVIVIKGICSGFLSDVVLYDGVIVK